MGIENGEVSSSDRNRMGSASKSKPLYVNTVYPTGMFSLTFTVVGTNSAGGHLGLRDSPSLII